MGEHGSPMIIVSESCRTHLRGRGGGGRGHRPSSLWYHRVRESFTRFSSVGTLENKALPVCCSFCSSLTYRSPVQKKKKKQKRKVGRTSYMNVARVGSRQRIPSNWNYQFRSTRTRYNFPSLQYFYFPLFVPFFMYIGGWNACEKGQKSSLGNF